MALAETLNIYKDTINLCKELLRLNTKINKTIRFSQYKTTVDKSFEALDLIRIANSDKETRADNLKIFIRLISEIQSRILIFTDLRFIAPNQSTLINKLLTKIIKQALGWLKTSQKNYKATAIQQS